MSHSHTHKESLLNSGKAQKKISQSFSLHKRETIFYFHFTASAVVERVSEGAAKGNVWLKKLNSFRRIPKQNRNKSLIKSLFVCYANVGLLCKLAECV